MNRIKKSIFLTLGILCVALGTIGAALPILPTTPFMLLAAFFFAKSSERLHHWLLNHPRFGPQIRNWQTHGAISKNTKLLAVVTMLGVLVLSFLLSLSVLVISIQAISMAAASAFILTRPLPPRS